MERGGEIVNFERNFLGISQSLQNEVSLCGNLGGVRL